LRFTTSQGRANAESAGQPASGIVASIDWAVSTFGTVTAVRAARAGASVQATAKARASTATTASSFGIGRRYGATMDIVSRDTKRRLAKPPGSVN
jgi:hypothetical protein